MSYAVAAQERAVSVKNEPSVAVDPAGPPAGPILLRQGDELHAVEVADIILISAADDYSEVVTSTLRQLARRSLAEFERELPPETFVRVHRSHLINLDHLVRAEPAGAGRMTLHRTAGEAVTASRTGTRLLRELAV